MKSSFGFVFLLIHIHKEKIYKLQICYKFMLDVSSDKWHEASNSWGDTFAPYALKKAPRADASMKYSFCTACAILSEVLLSMFLSHIIGTIAVATQSQLRFGFVLVITILIKCSESKSAWSNARLWVQQQRDQGTNDVHASWASLWMIVYYLRW